MKSLDSLEKGPHQKKTVRLGKYFVNLFFIQAQKKIGLAFFYIHAAIILEIDITFYHTCHVLRFTSENQKA